jgi:class 3 adenylate cyclase
MDERMTAMRKSLSSIVRLTGGERGKSGSRLSIRTKFLLMVLLTSLVGLAVITTLSSMTGKAALTEAAFNQLTSYRAAKKQQLEWYFQNLRNTFAVLGTDAAVVEAYRDLRAGFRTLAQTPIEASRRNKLMQHYEQNILPRLTNAEGRTPPLMDIFPSEPAAVEIQALYITENPNPDGQKDRLTEHMTQNPYTINHARHHPWLKKLKERFDYYDIMMVDGETGDMIYSVVKENDFGTNHFKGTFARTHHGRLVREILDDQQRGVVRMTDYDFYLGSYNQPQAFLAVPIFAGSEFLGVLVAQLSTDAINRFIHNGRHWRDSGLGETGSAYMAGIEDRLMRSDAREIFENPEKYIKTLEASRAFPTALVERIKTHKTTILYYPVNPEPLLEVAKGRSGTTLLTSRKGGKVLISYAPLNIADVKWAILTRIDENEVLASQKAFNRTVLTVACLLALISTLAALVLARNFLKPVTALLDGIERLRRGEREVNVSQASHDEFGELVGAFNSMAGDIKARDAVIEGKNRAYAQLLKRIFPETIADRMKGGDLNFSESFNQVSVIYVIVEGLHEATDEIGAETGTRILNEIVDAFDNVADEHGIEKVKTIGDHYLAVAGLDVARLDHARRALEFVVELSRQIVRINQSHNLTLCLRAGIASGETQAGLVGNRRFVYDIWGMAASLARRIVYNAEMNAVRLNAEAYNAISDKAGLGEELIVSTLSLGEIKTYQYRLDGESQRQVKSSDRPRNRAAE